MTEAINFNCQCEDVNDNLTLAEYRQRMLVRAGFAAVASNPPPGVTELFDTFLQDAQEFMYRKYPALRTRRFFRWEMQEGTRFYGMRENDENDVQGAVTITIASPGVVGWLAHGFANGQEVSFETTGALPTGLVPGTHYFIINQAADTFQVSATSGGAAINTSGSQSGVHTATVYPTATCVFNMDPYKNIEGAWVEDVNGTWLPMVEGIPGTFYTTVTQPSIPLRYEIRQCIEVFPAPNSNDYSLWIKGHFGLSPFTDDDDKPTIDGHLVYLWALANCLEYYGKPNAVSAAAQAREYLGELVAGTHGSRRYVPGTEPMPPAVMPVLLPLPGE